MGPTQAELNTPETAPVTTASRRYDTTYPQDSDPERIREGIAHTRGEMDETLSALGDRLHPRHLLDQVFDLFRGSSGSTGQEATETLSRVAKKLAQQVRRHPIPSLLFASGLAWMMYESDEEEARGRLGWDAGPPPTPEHAGSFVDARTGEPYDESYGEAWRGEQGEAGKSWTESAKEAGGRVADTARSASSAAGIAMSKAGEWTSGAASSAKHYGRSARAGATRLSERVTHGAQSGYTYSRDTLAGAIDDYPLAVGAAVAAIGLLAGLALPRTRREDELMGEQADRLKEQAQHTAEDAMQRGKQVAAATVAAAAEEAQAQGLSPEQLRDKAAHVARETAHAAREAAADEGLAPDQLRDKAAEVAREAKDTAKQEAERHKEEMTR